jgi:predicted HTH transcriptional regulator
MIDGAAKIYCRPEIPFRVREWQAGGKRVLEIIIEEGKYKPHLAQDEEGSWVAYIRQGDQNFRAGKVMLKVWERRTKGHQVTIRFRQPEQTLLSFLEAHNVITISKFRRIAGITSHEAEEILANFILLEIIKTGYSLSTVTFRLTEGYRVVVDLLARQSGEGY